MKRTGRKISVICTVRNEGASVRELVDSILSQKRLPDEVVFVDGGSTDGTVEVLKKYGKDVRVISSPGANIAKGRNVAIASAKSEWIASIDGGCVADKYWLANLEKRMPFSDVVSGAYLPISRNNFERVQGKIVVKSPSKLGSSFLPSSRSVAFKKAFWERAGGYPEDTYTAEDTLFDLAMKKSGARFALARDAIVKWRMRPSLGKFAKQFFLYGKGDGKTGLVMRMPLNLLMVCLFVSALVAPVIFGNFWILGAASLGLSMEALFRAGVSDFPVALVLVAVKRSSYSLGVLRGLFLP